MKTPPSTDDFKQIVKYKLPEKFGDEFMQKGFLSNDLDAVGDVSHQVENLRDLSVIGRRKSGQKLRQSRDETKSVSDEGSNGRNRDDQFREKRESCAGRRADCQEKL